MDVGIRTRDVIPKRKIQAVGFERSPQFEQGVGGADFLKGDNVGPQRANALADFRLCLRGFDVGTRFGGLVQIIFYVLSGHANRAGGNADEREKYG